MNSSWGYIISFLFINAFFDLRYIYLSLLSLHKKKKEPPYKAGSHARYKWLKKKHEEMFVKKFIDSDPIQPENHLGRMTAILVEKECQKCGKIIAGNRKKFCDECMDLAIIKK